MAFVYITEQGAFMGKKGRRIVVRKDDNTLLDIACHKLEGIMVFGNVQVSTQALALLLKNGIELAFFSRRGRLRGQITAPFTKNIELRVAQYGQYRNPEFRLRWSRAVLKAKINNCRRLVADFAHNHRDLDFRQGLHELAVLARRVDRQNDIDGLLGIEGQAARVYFGIFGKMLLADLNFDKRRKRPPPDPVNALLSLSYTMLFNEISSLLDGLGFDPYLGFFHAVRYGRASLAADLMEEFRAPVADRFVLRFLNRKMIVQDDFIINSHSGECHLRKDSLKTYFHYWDKWLRDSGSNSDRASGFSFRELFRRQAEAAMVAIYGRSSYKPYMAG